MSTFDLFFMAVKNLLNRKLRTFLTSLGVIVGSASIVMMISLGIGINKSFEDSISEMGDITVINVYDPSDGGSGGRMGVGQGDKPSVRFSSDAKLDDKTVANVKEIKGVKSATGVTRLNIRVFSGKYEGWGNILGIDPSVMKDFGFETIEGRLLESGERLGAVAGSRVGNSFYNPNQRYFDSEIPQVNVMEDKIELTYDWSYGYEDPFAEPTEKIAVKPYQLNIVGLLKGANYERDNNIFMDLKDVKIINREQEKFEKAQSEQYGYGGSGKKDASNVYEKVWVKCEDMNLVEGIAKEIEEMGFYAETVFGYLEEMKEMSKTLQIFLGLMGFITLFVSALGIANTMITSTYERTREIGIMKVIGATIKDIKKLFLLESALIGFIGGGFGIVLSYGASYFLNVSKIDIFGSGGQTSSVIPIWLPLFTLGFSAVIGLVSGYLPAIRATRLSALAAIKSE